MPIKSSTTPLPSGAPCAACVQRLPKLNSRMRKNQKRSVRFGSASRGLDSWSWDAQRVTRPSRDGAWRNERTCSWKSRTSSWRGAV